MTRRRPAPDSSQPSCAHCFCICATAAEMRTSCLLSVPQCTAALWQCAAAQPEIGPGEAPLCQQSTAAAAEAMQRERTTAGNAPMPGSAAPTLADMRSAAYWEAVMAPARRPMPCPCVMPTATALNWPASACRESLSVSVNVWLVQRQACACRTAVRMQSAAWGRHTLRVASSAGSRVSSWR